MTSAPAVDRRQYAAASTQSVVPPESVAAESLSVTFNDVGRAFDGRTVLRNVSLTVTPGEVVAILGSSGCGKSTLLRAVGGLDEGFTGDIVIGDSPVTRYDERTAVGFQEPRLLPWRSIRKNVELGLPRDLSKSEGQSRVDELLELVGLAERAHLRPREISGGMAQRASLARALARQPGVLLLDEPFGALDALTRLKMQDLLLDVHAKTGTTVLLVTHDVNEALQLADRILLLGGRGTATAEGATVKSLVSVPGIRPRDRAATDLAQLRSELYAGLGVSSR
ncbi:ABC transporter ATP-binding protein [Nesterenkonia haasae]|uniref:ABC transporter ATP-binding protein n=1 Tax=Nesterenkonia haasae TaxID=2587813 RepID=UPI001390EC09|nr:ABC transporter ATP-binding protein [Nesterenkonia haasae]NDK31485.1 ABC transporter ATP-binding protein [Nesterenkonia haasae]